ncbi:DUF3955 domain-containing protein [Staphylococcus sp. 11261D007BR]
MKFLNLKFFIVLCLSLSIISFMMKAFIGSYVDQEGLLHEPFFLIPLGFLFLLITLILILIKTTHYLSHR